MVFKTTGNRLNLEGNMADKIQNAYETSKNIYDDVLTQGNIFSKLYIKLFWSGTDVGRILRTFKIKKNVEVTDNGKIII